jgi:Acetyltransferase (GNAT) domain
MTAEILAATEHLVLRRMTNDDAAALAAYRSDPVQARYQSWETPYPLDSARALIAQMRNVRFAQPGVWLQIGIETSGRLIGDIAVRVDGDDLGLGDEQGSHGAAGGLVPLRCLGRPPQLSPACPLCGSPVPTRGHRRHRQGAALCGQVDEGLPAPHRAAVDAAMRLPGVASLGHHSPFRGVTSLRLNGRRGSRKVPSWVSPVTRCHEQFAHQLAGP